MNVMDKVKVVNKRRREMYSKSKAHDESLLAARNALAAREQNNVRKSRSRLKKQKAHQQIV